MIAHTPMPDMVKAGTPNNEAGRAGANQESSRMNQTNNGGAAFPVQDIGVHGYYGMTLRDYLAAQALPAILAVPEDGIQSWAPDAKGGGELTAAEAWARNAYQIADAMLAERAK